MGRQHKLILVALAVLVVAQTAVAGSLCLSMAASRLCPENCCGSGNGPAVHERTRRAAQDQAPQQACCTRDGSLISPMPTATAQSRAETTPLICTSPFGAHHMSAAGIVLPLMTGFAHSLLPRTAVLHLNHRLRF